MFLFNNLEDNVTVQYDVNDINNFIDYLYKRYYLMPDHFVYTFYEEVEEVEEVDDENKFNF